MKKLLILALCGLSYAQMKQLDRATKWNQYTLSNIWKDIQYNHMANGKPNAIPYALCDVDVQCGHALGNIPTRFFPWPDSQHFMVREQ